MLLFLKKCPTVLIGRELPTATMRARLQHPSSKKQSFKNTRGSVRAHTLSNEALTRAMLSHPVAVTQSGSLPSEKSSIYNVVFSIYKYKFNLTANSLFINIYLNMCTLNAPTISETCMAFYKLYE